MSKKELEMWVAKFKLFVVLNPNIKFYICEKCVHRKGWTCPKRRIFINRTTKRIFESGEVNRGLEKETLEKAIMCLEWVKHV